MNRLLIVSVTILCAITSFSYAQIYSIGAASPAIGTSSIYTSNNHYLLFNVMNANGVKIHSIDVYPGTINTPFTIVVQNSATTVIASYTDTVTTTSGAQTVPVNFIIPQGTGYRLGLGVHSGMVRNSSGANYPYTVPGLMSITGNTFNTAYYYFHYNLQISDPSYSPLNNAGVTQILSPVDSCDGLNQNVVARIKNFGSNQIDTVEVHWTVNGVAQTTLNYTSLLDTAGGGGPDTADVVLGSIALTAGVNDTIVAWTAMPNNKVDSANTDDTSRVTVKGFDFPSINLTAFPGSTLCYGNAFQLKANGSALGSFMYQWKINTVDSGGPTTNDTWISPPLNSGDSVNVDLITDQCDTTGTYAVPSNYITMIFNPEPISIGGSTLDSVRENSEETYLVSSKPGSVFTWSAVGGTVRSPNVGDTVTVDWGGPMDTAKIIVTEKDAGNCSYTNVRDIVVTSTVGLGDRDQRIGLGEAYPNPANTSITIPLYSDGNWDVDLSLYDITGKKVKSIYNGQIKGNNQFTFGVDELKNGMYFYKITTSDGYESVKKIAIQH